MSKIIDFSSLHEERCVELRIEHIKKELKKERISSKKLRHLQDELYHLSLVVTESLQNQATLTQYTMSQFLTRQTELGALICDCQHLFIDKKVDSLTEHAQKLARASLNPSCNVSQKIGKLKKSILSLTHQEALSLENRQMINLAKKYLHDAAARCYHEETVKDPKTIRLDFKKTNSERDLIDPYDLSVALYEIAGDLYYCHVAQGLSSFFCLSPSVQEAIKTLIAARGGSFELLKQIDQLHEWKNNLYKVIQALIGYSNQLLYDSITYPEIQEIDSLFKELSEILSEDVSANF